MSITKFKSDELVSLTLIYKQALERGLVDPKKRADPAYWAKTAGAEFIDVVAGTLNSKKIAIYKTTRGKGGDTKSHPQIALQYAKYLSPELAMEVNETYMRAKVGDVSLAAEVYDRATVTDQKRLEARIAGKAVRRDLTDKLQEHGVTGMGFGQCTNALYIPVLGGKAPDILKAKGLPAKSNLRDNLSATELADIIFAERLAKKRLEDAQARGNQACAVECAAAGRAVVAALVNVA